MPVKSFRMPAHACNAHLHIIDPAYPNDGKAEAQIGTVSMYRRLAEELQLERAVFVQAKPFGTDNTCLTDAIARFGAENARGIAVVQPDVTDAELEALHAKGVRGLRYSVWNPSNAVVSFDDCAPLSERVKHLGWNMQLHMGAKQIAQHADVIRALAPQTGADAFHLSAKAAVPSGMEFRREAVPMGAAGLNEFELWRCDEGAVRAAREALDAVCTARKEN